MLGVLMVTTVGVIKVAYNREDGGMKIFMGGL